MTTDAPELPAVVVTGAGPTRPAARFVTPAWQGLLVAVVVTVFVLGMSWSSTAVDVVRADQVRGSWFLLASAVVAAVVVRSGWQSDRLRDLAAAPVARALGVAAALCLGISSTLVGWFSHVGQYGLIAGTLPWSDAAGYHEGGLRLLHQGQLDAFNMRRPLNAGFYATRMALTGDNYWASLLLQGLIVGACGYLLVRAVTARLGAPAGLLCGGVLFALIQPLVKTTLSESLGFSLGCLALTALWRGVTTRSSRVFALGLLMLTLALNVRASAFFVLPMLLLWLLLDGREGRRLSWKPFGLGLAAVVLGFGLNAPMNALYGTGQSGYQGNFSFSLYGLSKGGAGWQSGYQDFANRHYPTEAALTSAVYDAAFEQIRAHPLTLMKGIAQGFRYYVVGRIFGFAPLPVNGVLSLLTLVGWPLLLFAKKHRRHASMLLCGWIGILMSAPFIAPDGGSRVMAPVVPFLAVIPAAGLARLAMTKAALAAQGWPGRRGSTDDTSGPAATAPQETTVPSEPSSRLITVACLTAAGVVVLGPHAAVAVSAAPTFASPRCADTEVPVVMLAGDSSPGLTLLGDATTHSHVGHVEVGTAELARDLTVSAPELAAAFRDAQPGMTVLESYNLMAARDDSIGGTTFLVVPTAAVPHDKTLISTCARPLRNSENPAYAVMYATTLGR